MSRKAHAGGDDTPPNGTLYALVAFGIWSGFPAFFKLLADVPSTEVLAHRIIWSLVFVGILLAVRGAWRTLGTVFSDRRLLLQLCLSSTLVSINWFVFIWAVANDRVLESSLGYFINPLINVLLGVLLLGERLRRLQWAAIALAAAGVLFLIVKLGELPWVALTVAVTFGCYGLVRKQTRVDPFSGLFVETLLLTPLAFGYLLWLNRHGAGQFLHTTLSSDLLLVLAGILTALPLLLFTAAAQRLRLSTLGLLQYTVPSGHFLLAVLAFGEPFTAVHVVTFGCIWSALAIYVLDSYRPS